MEGWLDIKLSNENYTDDYEEGLAVRSTYIKSQMATDIFITLREKSFKIRDVYKEITTNKYGYGEYLIQVIKGIRAPFTPSIRSEKP